MTTARIIRAVVATIATCAASSALFAAGVLPLATVEGNRLPATGAAKRGEEC